MKAHISVTLYMSTENSVDRPLKTRSLLTKFGTCSIAVYTCLPDLWWYRTIISKFEGLHKLLNTPEHTDKLEAILKEHGIAFPEFWGW